MKAVAAFNQKMALVEAFSVLTNEHNFKLCEGSVQALVFLLVPSRACPPPPLPPAGHHARDDFAVQMSR